MVAIAGAAPAIAACLTNPVCATGAAVIGFGGMMMAAKNAEHAKASSPAGSSASAPQDPKDECNQKYNDFYKTLSQHDKTPTQELAQSIAAKGQDYMENCKDADPEFDVRAENMNLDWLVSKRY